MYRTTALALCLVAFTPVARAQESTKASPKPRATPSAKVDDEKAEAARQRRANALFLLSGLADEAAKFDDLRLRAHVQARAANLIWATDRDRATALFRRAWSSARLAHDRELATVAERQSSASGEATVTFEGDIREEVLDLSFGRDRALGDAFLAELTEDVKREAADAKAKEAAQPSQFGAPNEAFDQRLRLATSLLKKGEVARAVEVADPALVAPYVPAVEFLTNLRAKDAAVADVRYSSLLTLAAADPTTDAYGVSTLSSYVYSPHSYIFFTSSGASMSSRDSGAAVQIPSEVKRRFFTAATRILTRPMTPERLDQTTPGRAGTYLTIARLLPLASTDSPESVEPLRLRMTTLDLQDADQLRENNARMLRYGLPSETTTDSQTAASSSAPGSLDERIDRADRMPQGDERDAAYVQVALAAAGQRDGRARDLANGILEPALRRSVVAYIDFQTASAALAADRLDEVVEVVRAGELAGVHKAWLLAGVASRFVKSDKGRAREVLGEAADAARHIDLDDADRARAFFAVATATIEVDPERVDEAVSEAVKSANRAPAFTGRESGISFVVKTKNSSMAMGLDAPELNIDKVFVYLADRDLVSAVALAKSFEAETPRSVAVLVVGESVLAEKQTKR